MPVTTDLTIMNEVKFLFPLAINWTHSESFQQEAFTPQ